MNKLVTRINWVNDTDPAINDTHLNQMDSELDAIDDRVIGLEGACETQAEEAEAWAVGERGGEAVQSGDPTYHNNSKYHSQQASNSATNAGTSETNAGNSATAAGNSATAAGNSALVSEGYANGTQNGILVTSGPYYENNAKFWKDQAQQIASQTIGGLSDVTINAPTNGQVLTYDADNNIWRNSDGGSVETKSGNPLAITTDSAQVSRGTTITLNPIQAAGTPTPSNSIPIYGYDSVEVNGYGKNLLNADDYYSAYKQSEGVYRTTAPNLSAIHISLKDYVGKTLTFSSNISAGASQTRIYVFAVINGSGIAGNQITAGVTGVSKVSFTVATENDYVQFNYGGTSDTNTVSDIQLELGSTATAYEPYQQSNNLSLPLPETVYGGTLDVESGVLTVTKEMVDLGDLNWSQNQVGTFYAHVSNKKDGSNTLVCSCYEYEANQTFLGTNLHITDTYAAGYEKTVFVTDTSYTDENTFKTSVTGQKLVYELATPYTIQLNPKQIALLAGANTLTSNGTSITVIYREGKIATLADVKAANDSLANTLEDAKNLVDVYGFIEHNAILDPVNRIEYIGENSNYTPLTVTMGGGYNLGGWANFPLLKENKPCMVKSDGSFDYELDERDYTKKKADGTASDVANTSYDGGAFSWIKKIYKKEFMKGTDRYVLFSFTKKVGFEPIGFVDGENNELDGVWIPMFYGALNGTKLTSLSGLQPDYSKTTAQQKTSIDNFSNRARFFGGSIVETLTDIMIMLGHSTDTQAIYGNGNMSGYNASLSPTYGVKANAVVNGGQFYGTSDGTSLNKAFHSIVLVTWQQWQKDPYVVSVNGKLKVSPNYEYDITGATYQSTNLDYANVGDTSWHYPDTYKTVPNFGSMPQDTPPFNGSATLGGCDGFTVNAAITAWARRFGVCHNAALDGARALALGNGGGYTDWNIGASVLLLPKAPTYTAEDIGGGTFGGQVNANTTAMANLGTAMLRNMTITDTQPTVGASTTIPDGTPIIVYE